MIHEVDDTLRAEVLRFKLMFACPNCAQFDSDRDQCSLGYPTAPHKNADLTDRTELSFCKAFELG